MAYHFKLIANPSKTPEDESALQEYYTLRAHAFEANWNKTIYQPHPNKYDEREQTVFLLMYDDKKLVAGTRFVVCLPHQTEDRFLPCEDTKQFLQLSRAMPHLKLEEKCYAELGGTIVDPASKGQNLSNRLYQEAYRVAPSLRFTDKDGAEHGLDFIATHANERVIKSTINASKDQGFHTIVRSDTRWHDTRLGSHPVLVLQALDKDFPFLDEGLKRKGVAKTGSAYLLSMASKARS